MAELLEEQRESWGTRGAFILAAVGSAVGLGNLWGFPYKLYGYGGGAFLVPYIVALLLVGIPLMILEFSIGHYTQRAAPNAFKQAHRRFELVGWWGILMGFVVVTYYTVLLAYCFSFLWYSIVGIFNGGNLPWAGEGLEGVRNANDFFNVTYLDKIKSPALGRIRWNIVLPLLVTWGAMYLCIFRGVRLVGKIVWLTVPLPWLMLLILAVRGLTLPGSMQGLAYYLDPEWSQLTKPITWRYAFGQVFFSLSLAWGVMVTYASFLHRKSDINNNAAVVSLADFATSFVAGLAVFATLGGMAFVTQQAGKPVAVENVVDKGPALAFIAFPYALAQLPYSAWFSFIFFFALVTLGIDSAFSITESVLASVVDKTGWRRDMVLPAMSLVGLGFGLVFVTQGGIHWLETMDGFANGTWGIAFLGLLECLVLGWLWRIGILRRHANSRSDWSLGSWWDYMIRLVIPVLLGTLFFWQLFDDVSGGHLFSVDLEAQRHLDNRIISEELQREFENHGVRLTPEATVSGDQIPSGWLVTDKDSVYVIRTEKAKLGIYTGEGGFLRDPQGQWKLPNCVGLGIMALIPVAAFVLSLVKGRREVQVPRWKEQDLEIRARFGGLVVLILALILAAGLIITLLSSSIPEVAEHAAVNPLYWALVAAGIVLVLLANHILDQHNTSSTQASWLARWAGIVATMDVSAFIAVILIGLTRTVRIDEVEAPIHHELSGISYVILLVVFLIIVSVWDGAFIARWALWARRLSRSLPTR